MFNHFTSLQDSTYRHFIQLKENFLKNCVVSAVIGIFDKVKKSNGKKMFQINEKAESLEIEIDFSSIPSLSTEPEEAAESEKKNLKRLFFGWITFSQSGHETDVLSFLDQLMAALREAFNPRSCLPEYKNACYACLPFYLAQKIVDSFFGIYYKNSKKCRSCYRRTKKLHGFCSCFGLCLYVIVLVLLASGLVSLLLRAVIF